MTCGARTLSILVLQYAIDPLYEVGSLSYVRVLTASVRNLRRLMTARWRRGLALALRIGCSEVTVDDAVRDAVGGALAAHGVLLPHVISTQ